MFALKCIFEPEVVEVTSPAATRIWRHLSHDGLDEIPVFSHGTGLIREMFSFLCHEDRRFVEEAALGQTKQERINKNICGCEI
jgi:hypothetical protein